MSTINRLPRQAVPLLASLGLAAGVLLASSTAAAAAPASTVPNSVATHPPGRVGSSILLASRQDFAGYDVAADAAGTAYIGWISSSLASTSRSVHLCTLPVGATRCTGGVQTIATTDPSTAAGLRVLSTPSGRVTLVWFHDTTGSENGPEGGEIAEATAVNGVNLSAAHDVANAPSFGSLFDAEYGPGNTIWTVAYAGEPDRRVQVHPGLSAAFQNVSTPWSVSRAQLAFVGSRPVLTVEKAGAISESAFYATRSAAGTWSRAQRVVGTWTLAGATLKDTRAGLRLIATVNSATYRPVIARWNGHGFDRRQLTADRSPCAPSSHDGYTDPSGRLLDVSWECNSVTIADYANDAQAAILRFPVAGTGTFEPQIASGTRGVATVAWTAETDSANGDFLHVERVRLPDTTRSVTRRGAAGRVTLLLPTSCVPPVDVRIGLGVRAARGWSVRARSMRLAGRVVAGPTLDAARLTPGRRYTLSGAAEFADGSRRSTVRVSMIIRSCPTS